jgi:hypothetical protein
MQSRRTFISACAKTSSALAGMPLLTPNALGASVALPADAQFFVFVQIYGAWDPCLAFDPKDRESRLSNGSIAFDQPYAFEEVQTYGQIPLAPDGAILGQFADRLAIVNGVDMELDNGHSPAIVMTGSPQGSSSKPFIQSLVADRHPYVSKCMIPHLYASYDGFFPKGTAAEKTITISSMDAHRVLFANGGGADLSRAEAFTMLAADTFTGSDRRTINRYTRALSQATLTRQILDQTGASSEPPSDIDKYGDFAASLFKSGIVGSLTWSLGESYVFDTHSLHYENHQLKAALSDIANFAIRLGQTKLSEGTTVLDRTTFVIAAEYARTPRLNGSRGKDHNIETNSLVFMGHNVRPGVFGKSGERIKANGQRNAHAGLPVDFSTGAVSANGDIIKARNVWAGSSEILGVDLSQEFGAGTKAVSFLRA